MVSIYAMIGTETQPRDCSEITSRVLLGTTLFAWVTLPLIYLSMFYFSVPIHGEEGISLNTLSSAVSSQASAQVNTPTPPISLKSCLQHQNQQGGGWEPVGEGKICSEAKLLPGGFNCPPPRVWIYASKICLKAGARLCTSDELLAGAGTTMRCGEGERQPVKTAWSSTRCGVGGSNYLVQYSSGQSGARIANTTRPSSGGVINCDLSSGRHQVVCCADFFDKKRAALL